MPGEYSGPRRERIHTSCAASHDARFLAALDGLVNIEEGVSLQDYLSERRAYWSERFIKDDAQIFVAREGGMYMGYLALSKEAEFPEEINPVINPRHEQFRAEITKALISKAGISLESSNLLPSPELVAS